MSVLLLELVWYVSTVVAGLPALFEFALGALLLRHARNIALFRAAREGTGVQGQVRYARRLSLRTSAAELLSFAVFLALLAPLTACWFVAGGAIACAATGAQHWRRAGRA